MTKNASDSPLGGIQHSRLGLDLLKGGRLAPLPTALLEGRDLDLLSPLKFLRPGDIPSEPPPAIDRGALADALATANEGYGHPRARQLADKLADPKTRVVVTGQQPGLYGGPQLTLTKMLAAVRWAEVLEEAGQPAVPIFWVATEDHDWKEVTKTSLLTREGPKSYDLGDDLAELCPVGARTFDDRLLELEERISADLSGPAAESFRFATRFYRPGVYFGDAFCAFLTALLGERAPLFLDSMLPGVKTAQSPWLRLLIERRTAVDEGLLAATERLGPRGYKPQVRYQPGLSPLFLIKDGERRRIQWTDNGYQLRGSDDEGSIDELIALAENDPAALSPGVLARPAVQDAFLGTTLQVMGPAETSYLAQVSAVYRVLEIPAPYTTPRPQVLFLEPRQVAHLGELDISLADLLGSSLEQLLGERLGEDFISPAREKLEAIFDELREPVLAADANLEKPWRKTRDQLNRALDQLSSKVQAAVARKNEVWHRRLHQIHDACLPDGHLQERHLTVVHYLARYGPSYVEAYGSDFELDPRRLQVLYPGGAP